MKESLTKGVITLKLEKKVSEKLFQNKIETIFDLCKYSRMDLMDIGLLNTQINKIRIALQLTGYDLKANHAKRNILIE